MLRARAHFALAAACLAALATAGCGEREEPEIATANGAQEEFSILGQWSGRLTQKGVKPFGVRATIDSLERSNFNVVRYSGEIGCAGNWDYLGATETSYRFREVIDRGEGAKCKGVGTVTLTPLTQDRLDYRFTGGGITSSGVLTRG